MSRRPNIIDVATEAGVSKATVSRFFNHRERLLSPDIAARVEAAIAKLGYSPSPVAQALSHGRSRLIGLVVADITNPFSVAVLRGAEKVCQEAGYLVILFNLGNDRSRERIAIETLAKYQVDGFILNTQGQDSEQAEVSALHGVPAVLIDRRHPGLAADFVSLDNPQAMRSVCEHLAEQGWCNFLYLTQELEGVSSRLERSQAFTQCMASQGLDKCSAVQEVVSDDNDALDQMLRDWHRDAGPGGRIAVIAGNSVVTLWVAAAVARMGWVFGQDIGFVGVDDPDWAPLIAPGLSTMAQPTDDIGRCAAQCLLDRLAGLKSAPRESLLPGALIVRGSSVRREQTLKEYSSPK